MPHRLDTETQVFFYADEFYCLSNFSPFRLYWRGMDFDTSEHAYHWEKFRATEADLYGDGPRRWDVQPLILKARSAHEAYKVAEQYRHLVRPDWADVKLAVMRSILIAKLQQHEYVRRKLLEAGEREVVEDSFRDAFWGWGPNKDGENMLGKLWMAIRNDLKQGRIEGV